MKRTVLLNPGPVNVTERVRQALLKPDLCHREKEFSDLMQSIRSKLVRAFGIQNDYDAVLTTGSGTAALEMAVCSCLSEGETMLVIRNGVYGDRISAMAEAYGFNTQCLDTPWGEPPVLSNIEQVLKQNPKIEVVALVHHETTTGLLNPVHEIGELVRKYKKRFLVDSISGLAGDALDFNRAGVDFCVGTANKCLQGLPGVSFVLARKTEMARLKKIPERSHYFNLYKNHQAQEKGDTLFTPAVQIHYALDAALDELLEETVKGRINRYSQAAAMLRKGFREMGLEFIVSETHLSNTLTALKLPEDVTYQGLHDRLKGQGFVIYAGQKKLSESIFRIANMGDITTEEFQRLLDTLKNCLSASTPS
jgi:2-aminoethylphosphonate-pyruvate transaminase